jgi:hypothetical protein
MSKKASSPLPSSKKRSTKARTRDKANISSPSPFDVLCEADERINPAIILAEELMRKDVYFALEFEDLERAEQTLAASRREIERVESQFTALVKSTPAASAKIPVGF